MRHFLLSRLVLAAAVTLSAASLTHAQPQDMGTPAPSEVACRQFYVATHFARGKQQTGWDVKRLVPKLKELGVEGIRDECSWSSVEKTKGVYAIGEMQREWLNAMRDNGFKVIICLTYRNENYTNPLDPDGFANYAAFLAKELKSYPNITAFEIYNEPGNFYFRKTYGGEWNGKGESPWLGKFAELIEKTTAAIKRENPGLPVWAGAGVPAANHNLIIKHPNAFKQVDATVEHPYTYRLPPEVAPWGGAKNFERDGVNVADDDHSMKSVFTNYAKLTKEKLGRELPVHVTEFGYASFTRQEKASLYAGFTETAQEVYHARAMIQGLGVGVPTWTVYDLVEDGTKETDEESRFGLLKYDTLQPKPVFKTLSRLAKLLGPKWERLPASTGELVVENKAKNDPSKDEWAHPVVDPYSLAGPQVYWFKVPDGMIAFVWTAGRINIETKPFRGAIELKSREALGKAQLIDLSTGEAEDLKLTTKGDAVTTAPRIPVGSWPVAVKFSSR